jgi:hypothetical protein
MKIEISGKNEREKIGALLDSCNIGLSPHVVAGQVRRGFWDEGGTDKIFLLLQAISPATALKIRRLIEQERNQCSKQQKQKQP